MSFQNHGERIKTCHPAGSFTLAYMNARSIGNKTYEIREFILDKDLDALAVTETWLHGDARDDAVLSEFLPTAYNCEHIPRHGRGGGGVALLLRDTIHCQKIRTQSFASFEHMECLLATTPPVRIVVIYRPPPPLPTTSLSQTSWLIWILTCKDSSWWEVAF
jgi:hypothetical protein